MATIYIPSLNVTLVNGEEAQPLTGDAAGQAWASLLKGDDIKTWSDVGIPGRTWQNDIPYHAVAKAVFSRQKMESATETEDTFCGSSSEGGGGKKVAFHGMISLSDGAAQVTAPDWPVCEASVGTAPALSDEITVTYNGEQYTLTRKKTTYTDSDSSHVVIRATYDKMDRVVVLNVIAPEGDSGLHHLTVEGEFTCSGVDPGPSPIN